MATDVTVQQLTSQGGEVEIQQAKREQVHLRVARGSPDTGVSMQDYHVEVQEGMVVLDAVHRIQAEQDPSLACRWNCKAGKCGSCSAEINGQPRLMCMTRMDTIPSDQPCTLQHINIFPLI